MTWIVAGLEAKTDILRQIHALEPCQRFQPESAAVDTLPLPFYQGGLLIRCRDRGWRESGDYLWYVKLPGQEIIALDGSVANIHHLNFHAGLRLTEALLPAYLKFRLFFGKEGENRRGIVEDRPVAIEMSGADFICTCSFHEEHKLYTGRFKITLRGETELLEKNLRPADC